MEEEKKIVPYTPSEDERKFILQTYNDFLDDKNIKEQTWKVLGNRTLKQFWDDSDYDYNVLVDDDENNPVTQYSSGISRDKSNTFITGLALQLLYPGITAQNDQQEIDNIISKVSRSVLEWQFNNDGRPAESGLLKNTRYIHKQVVNGTVHIQDDFTPDGRLISSLVPNEEVFLPNFYQPNLQLQSHLLRVSENKELGETEEEFGHLKNWKYVVPGMADWIATDTQYNDKYKGIVEDKRMTIVRVWRNICKKDIEKLKTQGKLADTVKKAKYYNVVINGVLMFDVNKLMPYHDGNYPMNKGIFESFSPCEFYWGNSMPNKARQDKKWLDGWKTLIRYKAKLSALPPQLNFSGNHIDEDIVIPAKITDMPKGMLPEQLAAIPGISNGITNGDILIMKDATEDIERSTASPQTSGQQTGRAQTARESIIIESNAQKAMLGLAQQIAFLQEARVYCILKRSYQLIPRSNIEKIAIPNQVFGNKNGIIEVIFTDLSGKEDDDKTKLEDSFKTYEEELKAEENDGVARNIFVIDAEYVNNLEFYCKAIAESLPMMTTAMRESKAILKYETYRQDPYIDPLINIRNLVRANGDNEDELIRKGDMLSPTGEVNTPVKDATMKSGAEKQSKQLTSELL